MNERGRYYNWMFTSYNEFGIKIPNSKTQFMVWQREECPKTKKKHWQGYIELTEKVSIKWLKENMEDNTIHFEPRKGTQKQAIDYCTKEDTRIESPTFYGSKKCQGNRSDLDSMVDAIESGMTSKEILLKFRGNALRHMSMICKGLESFHNCNKLDELILMDREGCFDTDEKCLEVEGNTKAPSTSQ